jgi:AcrR family transcriptional regulator
MSMSKGGETRHAVLDRAAELSRRVGLGGLTIGMLAEETQLSKSGLFAHFGSKLALQLAVLEHLRMGFEEAVARPMLKAPRGEARLRELFDRWLWWDSLPGGCPFIAAATEFDDQPGPVRDRLVADIRDLFDMIGTVFRAGVAEGQFRENADPEQFAQDFYGVILGFHFASRLLHDDRATDRARRAFDALLSEIRTTA